MEEEKVIGYHTTAIENVEDILKKGFHMSPSDRGHWLGRGIYFFSDLYFATEWGIIGVIKKETNDFEEWQDKCEVLGAIIDDEKYESIDLSSPTGYYIFIEFMQLLKNTVSEEEYEEIINKGYAYIIKVLENLEKVTHKKLLSKFDIVYATYPKKIYEKVKSNKPGDFIICAEKQICVKNRNAIQKIYVIKNNLEEIFNLVKRNRGVNNEK